MKKSINKIPIPPHFIPNLPHMTMNIPTQNIPISGMIFPK